MSTISSRARLERHQVLFLPDQRGHRLTLRAQGKRNHVAGAQLTRMSGSGPTVLGLFENEAAAKKAYQEIKNHVAVAVFVSTIGAIPKA